MRPRRPIRAARGFTLIELLVAITVMAVMAVMSWQGLDGMTRVRAQTQQRVDEVLAVQMGLAQWSADLDALAPIAPLKNLDWDGRVLRLVRQGSISSADGLLVVAWARRVNDGAGQWLRWQSRPLRGRGELEDAWQQATLWAQNPNQELKRREVTVTPLAQWQLFYYRQDAWTNPLSSDTAAPTAGGFMPAMVAADNSTPDGIRVVLTLPTSSSLAGVITRDWVRPTLGGNKS